MYIHEIYGKQKIGRPTKYKPEYCQMLVDYFEDSIVAEKIVDDPSGRGGTSTHYELVRVPSLFGFAAKVGVHRDTLYEWAKAAYPEDHRYAGRLKYPLFSDALTRAQALEAAIMFEYGATGRLNNTLTGMYWTNHLGFKDSKHLDLTNNGKDLPTPLLAGMATDLDELPPDDQPQKDSQAS